MASSMNNNKIEIYISPLKKYNGLPWINAMANHETLQNIYLNRCGYLYIHK